MNKVFLLLTVGLGVLVSSCNLFPVTVEFDLVTFENQRQAWLNTGPADYTYDHYSVGFTMENVRVQVENGVYTSSVPVGESYLEEYPYTISDIYRRIKDTYLRQNGQLPLEQDFYLIGIDVEYSADHIPEWVHYRYYQAPNLAVDGNFVDEIRNFTPTL